MTVEVATFLTGPLETNTYVVRSGADCWVIDPSLGPQEVIEFLRRGRAAPCRILLTHGHGDHVGGVDDLKAAFPGAAVCCPAADAAMLTDPDLNLSGPFGFPLACGAADEVLQPGQTLRLGPTQWQVLDTSGHTPGGVGFHCAAEGIVFTGDALFAEGIGRTDIPGGDLGRLLDNIRRHLLSLPDATQVYPGHGPVTTIGRERLANPFLGPPRP